MRQRTGTLAAALLLSAAGASAQVKRGSQEAGVYAGAAIPQSDTTVGGGVPSTTLGYPGPALGAAYDFMIRPNVSLGGDFGFRGFVKTKVTYLSGATGNLSADDLTLLAVAKYQFAPQAPLRPYGLLGLGYGQGSIKLTGPFAGTASGGGFAYAVGAGAEYDVNFIWTVGAELRWSSLTAEMDHALGAQSINSVDFLVTGRFKLSR